MADSPSQPRAKRQRVDKSGRFAALEKLKNLKEGNASKWDMDEEVDDVYEVVDEKEYAKRTMDKYGDWIEDDGTGYVEDGRDFFEDEDYSDGESTSKSKSKNSRKRARDSEKPAKGKGSIRNMFSNAVPKKTKEPTVNIADDDVLADILGELDEKKPAGASLANGSVANGQVGGVGKVKDDASIAKDYMENLMKDIKKKKEEEKKKKEESDDEMIDRILKPKRKEATKTERKVEAPVPVKVKEELLEMSSVSVTPKEAPQDDMDYSILDDEENDFEVEKQVVKNEPKSAEKPKKPETELEDMQNLLNNWENICNMDNFEEEMNTTANGADEQNISKDNLKIWYWDAWEDQYKRPGEVFLFGKMPVEKGEPKSVCVRIENIEKCIFLLPREYILDPITKEPTTQKVTMMDVYKEFENEISNEIGLKTFRSRKVTKNFAFYSPGVEVPETCDYMEVRYEGKKAPPNTKKKYNTIAHIFGSTTSSLETFLLDRKLKGPCWLNISQFRTSDTPLSWCKHEVTCSSPSSIQIADERDTSPPPMSVMTLNVRTALNPKSQQNEIVMISCLVNNRFAVDKPPPTPPFNRHFCGVSRPSVQNFPMDLNQKLQQFKSTRVTKMDTERALLSWFLATYQNIDADLIVTHDAHDCQIDAICDRISALKIPMWSRLGRLRMSSNFGRKVNDYFIGRLICDVKRSAEELIRSRSFDLDTLCTTTLKIKEGERCDVSNQELFRMYESGDGILKLITLTMQDCSFILRLMCELNVIPLALQITTICGNLMGRTLQSGRSERNEYLLLHAFTEKNYIVPDKKKKEVNWESGGGDITEVAQVTRKKAAYSGGLVLDPVKGLYEKYILLMDFNSLYPSIIQEYNICFTTVSEPQNSDDIAPLPDSTAEQGILPRQIRRLVERRREVKKLMAAPDVEPEQKIQYDIRQMALKLTANSMYGCLGFSQSRFFAQHLAALVTFKGREILTNTKSLVQKLNYDVIYGDTDSIMINTNITDYDQVFKIGHLIKQTVNKIYKQVELDIDGVFKCLLLLKKKKYAAVSMSKNAKGEVVYKQEHKGLDIVRRDWSQVAINAGKIVVNEILSDNQLDEKLETIHSYLEKVKQNILDGNVPVTMLTITKQLTKAPQEYGNSNSMPHVQVALRMNATKNKRFKRGDMVNYIICEDGTQNAAMQRAYHLDELKTNENLKVDTHYYLAQQIHPVVWRMCEPLEGTDASRIASCLGLDPSKFKAAVHRAHRDRTDDGEAAGEIITKTNLQKFRHCEKFTYTCVSCKKENTIASAFRPGKNTHVGVLQECSNAECGASPAKHIMTIRNKLILTMRSFVQRFYENWLVCDDPSCNKNTRCFSHVLVNNRPVCLFCKQGTLVRQYSERDLFNQLSYFQYMFDLTKHEQRNVTLSTEVEMAYNTLRETVDNLLDKSAYCSIDLSRIFGRLKPSDNTDLNVDRTIVVNL